MDTPATVGDLGEFDAAWRGCGERLPALVRVVYGLIGLSRLGERPVEVDRFAAYLDRSVDDALDLLGEQSGAFVHHQGRRRADHARPRSSRTPARPPACRSGSISRHRAAVVI